MNYNVSYANQAHEVTVASFKFLFDAKAFIEHKVKCYKKVGPTNNLDNTFHYFIYDTNTITEENQCGNIVYESSYYHSY